MNDMLPIKKENSLFEKIKCFFRKLFFRNTKEDTETIDNITTVADEQNVKNHFETEIKFNPKNDFLKDIEREKLIEEIEKDPALLYSLPIDKLEVLEKYYTELVHKEEVKLAQIKKAS